MLCRQDQAVYEIRPVIFRQTIPTFTQRQPRAAQIQKQSLSNQPNPPPSLTLTSLPPHHQPRPSRLASLLKPTHKGRSKTPPQIAHLHSQYYLKRMEDNTRLFGISGFYAREGVDCDLFVLSELEIWVDDGVSRGDWGGDWEVFFGAG